MAKLSKLIYKRPKARKGYVIIQIVHGYHDGYIVSYEQIPKIKHIDHKRKYNGII